MKPTADRRSQRTRKSLTDALIDLTLERSYDSVTVRDIAERAGVGYATFFRHYHGKEALLTDVVEAILAELLALIGPQDDPAETGRRVFVHAGKHAAVYRVLLDSPKDLLDRIRQVGTEGVLSSHEPRDGALVPPEVAANHITNSFLALIRWWLEHDRPYPAERMGDIYSELIFKPTQKLSFER